MTAAHRAAGREVNGFARSRIAGLKSNSQISFARAQVSRNLSRRLPYYLTPEEAHQLIDAAERERDTLFLN